VRPARSAAAPDDVQVAKASLAVEVKPDPAPATDVADLRASLSIGSPNPQGNGHDNNDHDSNGQNHDGHDPNGGPQPAAGGWDHQVRQYNPDWVQRDQFYRPVICNPYHNDMRVVYQYQGAPRIVMVPPLGSVVMDVVDTAVYNFTAAVVDAVAAPLDVAVGSFYGGGYDPNSGLPLPPPPPPPPYYDNVPVRVRYSHADYQPFVVSQVVDVGNDPQVGEEKVLLDGATPAWGQWTQTASGDRQFEVHQTQQLPGIDPPAEGPLPGNYPLTLANSSSPLPASGFSTGEIVAIAAAIGVAVVAFGVVGFVFYRRRSQGGLNE
jgi:hypothetical protein